MLINATPPKTSLSSCGWSYRYTRASSIFSASVQPAPKPVALPAGSAAGQLDADIDFSCPSKRLAQYIRAGVFAKEEVARAAKLARAATFSLNIKVS